MENRYLKIAGIYGILASITFFLLVSLSVILSSSWFSWTKHYLSEIGGTVGSKSIYFAYGPSSFLLNICFILPGLLIILFTIYIKKSKIFDNVKFKNIGLLFLSLHMLSLIGIGVFPVTLGYMHVLCSFIFFVSVPVILLFTGYITQNLFENKWFWRLNIIFTIIISSTVSFTFLRNFTIYSKAIAEIIVLGTFFMFIIIISIKLIKKSNCHIFSQKEYNKNIRQNLKRVLKFQT